MNEYYFLTPLENALDNFCHCNIYLNDLRQGQKAKIKWLYLALHSTIYFLAIYAISVTNRERAVIGKQQGIESYQKAWDILGDPQFDDSPLGKRALNYLNTRGFQSILDEFGNHFHVTFTNMQINVLRLLNFVRNAILHAEIGFQIPVDKLPIKIAGEVLSLICNKYPVDLISAEIKKDLLKSLEEFETQLGLLNYPCSENVFDGYSDSAISE